MRTRDEIETWVKSKQSPSVVDESLRLQTVIIELLLDIRDLLIPKPITLQVPPAGDWYGDLRKEKQNAD